MGNNRGKKKICIWRRRLIIIGAVVLAAGKSERMGQNKLIMKINGKPLIEVVLDALSETRIDEQVLVLGYQPERITKVLKSKLQNVKVTINEDYPLGMTSSFQKGLQMITYVDAAFLVLGDEPIFTPNLMNNMIYQMQLNKEKALIVSPIHKGKKGHPLLFHRRLFGEILSIKNPRTIRDTVHEHSDRMLKVEAPLWTTIDVDTPEDYTRLNKLIRAGHHPL